MSQQGANLPQDIEGSMSSGAGLDGTAYSGSTSSSTKLPAEIISIGSKLASPAINPPKDAQGPHDATTSPNEPMLAVVGLGGMTGSNSSSNSIKLVGEDNNGGSKLKSSLVVHSGDKNVESNPASQVVVHASEDNNGALKSANPTVEVLSASDSNKRGGRNELARGVSRWDGAAGDSDSVTESNAKSTRSSSGGDVQDDINDASKPAVEGSNDDKGKGIAVEADHVPHIWAERERRKKMKNMYNTLHSLLPHLPDKAGKATIVGAAVDYIKTLEGTIKNLEKLKEERKHAQHLSAGSSAASAPPMCHGGTSAPVTRESVLADMVQNWNAQQVAAAMARGSVAPTMGALQTWSAPNIAVSVTGNDAFITVCTPRQRSVLTKALYVLEKYRIDVVTANISSDENRSMFCIHAHINAASARFPESLKTAEDRFKLAVSEMVLWITN